MPVFVNVVVDLLPSRCRHTARIYCTEVVTSLYDSTVVAVWYNFSTTCKGTFDSYLRKIYRLTNNLQFTEIEKISTTFTDCGE